MVKVHPRPTNKMRDSDESSEVEPLVPIATVKSGGKPGALDVAPTSLKRDLKKLEVVAVFVVAFDTNHGWCCDYQSRHIFV